MDSLITATDGTPIRVSETGPPASRATATVVLTHGFCLNRKIWAPQIHHLRRAWPTVRTVSYDQRGHGDSGTADMDSYTLDWLADDLDTVIRTAAPTGPIILAGHSMGGMAVLAHHGNHPRTAERITGAALISTSAGGLTDTGIGRALATPAIPALRQLARHAPRLTMHAWAAARRAAAPMVGAPCDARRYTATAALAEAVDMITATDAATIAGFLAGLRDYDGQKGLTMLAAQRVPCAVLCGSKDPLTPPPHAQRIADAVSGGRVGIAKGAQHMLGLERPRMVAEAIDTIVAASVGAAPAIA